MHVYVCARLLAGGSSEPFFCTPCLSNTQVSCRVLAGKKWPFLWPNPGPGARSQMLIRQNKENGEPGQACET